jgi:hypothetical protein
MPTDSALRYLRAMPMLWCPLNTNLKEIEMAMKGSDSIDREFSFELLQEGKGNASNSFEAPISLKELRYSAENSRGEILDLYYSAKQKARSSSCIYYHHN